jgi:YYY domain-containing protein
VTIDPYSVLLIVTWLIPLWLLGWLALPVSRHLFRDMLDGGLAVGRVLSLALISLIAFWLASLHLLSLRWSPYLWTLFLLVGAHAIAQRKNKGYALELQEFVRQKRLGLIISDFVFVLAFLFFIALRLFRPEINSFEKPMDSAIIGSLSRSDFLPAENPWFAGMDFTNYYYFGHFMASLLKRTFATPLPYAYNLIQPAFCAFFLSTLWALCATLCQSAKRGTIAFLIVGIGGNFEPLRQWLSPAATMNRSASFPFLDWWSTSRVIPNTINESPFFTLAIGDAHAHFFALALTTLLFSSCYSLISGASDAKSNRHFVLIGFIGLELGALLMTNAWDFPLYGLLAFLCTLFWMRNAQTPGDCKPNPVVILRPALLPIALGVLVALPFLLRFKPQAGGIAWEMWPPPRHEFLLLWGGFIVLGLITLSLRSIGPEYSQNRARAHRLYALAALVACLGFLIGPDVFVLAATTILLLLSMYRVRQLFSKHIAGNTATRNSSYYLVHLLTFVGLIALATPHWLYIRGYFSGELRHQDTVFKFGQQAWLLFGLGASCGATALFNKNRLWHILGAALSAAVWTIPFLSSLSIFLSAVTVPPPPSASAQFFLSLNGARFLPASDQIALLWLEAHAPKNSFVIEAVGRDTDGNFVGAYGQYGRISALSGVPAYIGWPQHAGFWGAQTDDIQARLSTTEALFQHWPFIGNELSKPTTQLNGRNALIYYGALERATPAAEPPNLYPQNKNLHITTIFQQEQTGIFEAWAALPHALSN